MQKIFITIIICFFYIQIPADAFFIHKKDYKQIFLQDAQNAEKRNNHKSSFHSYEKAMYYYSKDKTVIQAYADFCERNQYFDKAEKLYEKLYILTKDDKYLFKKNLNLIKNGKLSNEELQKLTKSQTFSKKQTEQLNSALIHHYSYNQDWKNIKKICEKIPKNSIGKDIITLCIIAGEKTSHGKTEIGYFIRLSELYPDNSEYINKVLSMAEKKDDYLLQEKYIKKLFAKNRHDLGILYKLAGLYEKYGDYKKAIGVYNNLIALGDTNKHVIESKEYDLSVLKGKGIKSSKSMAKSISYLPKPLRGFKLWEKFFYEALDLKNYSKAQIYLDKMLHSEPKNTKLLKHQANIFFIQNDYKNTIIFLEKARKIKPLSAEDEKFLAYLYSTQENYSKSFEIIENLMEKNKHDSESLKLALQYAMSGKNWEKAIVYNEKLLNLEPNSEEFLKNKGDFNAIKQDFLNASKDYEKLTQLYPKTEYFITLTDFYMANQDFSNAEKTIEPIYNANPNILEIAKTYLNSLLSQQKIRQAYWVIKTNHLEKTKEGYLVMGDMAIADKDYYTALYDYKHALDFDSSDLIIQNKIAEAQRNLGNINKATSIYKNVLSIEPENWQAKLGLGYLEIDKKNFENSRRIFNSILKEKPTYRPAQIAMANSYISNDEKITAINFLDKLPQDNQTKLMKAQAYYDMNMWSDSKKELKNVDTKEAEELNYKIKRDDAITITPSYYFFLQQLAEEFNLDYHKFGLKVSQNTEGNKNVFMEYNVFVYSSGGAQFLNNVTHEFKGGVQARPSKKWEYHADLGVKVFEFGDGDMIITDSWIKHYFNDKLNLKLGINRNNIEQSYLSAVGEPIDGIFTGRAANTKLYFEVQKKLPRQFYSYLVGSYGFIYAQNLITNQYFEGMLGFGKLIYNNPKNHWINNFSADLVSYNSSYQYNLLRIYNNAGQVFGGYYSPSYFNATTLNLKAEGEIKKLNLKYGVKGFGGIQHAISGDLTTPTWGVSPYISYDINDYITVNAAYNHFTYANLLRDQFSINAVIRGFKKNAKK
jgi:tetratricopeptide (TPR) repeat protein